MKEITEKQEKKIKCRVRVTIYSLLIIALVEAGIILHLTTSF